MRLNVTRIGLGLGLVGSLAVGALVACSEEQTNPPAATANAGDTVKVHISAATGGVVEDKGGKAKLSIPPGALAQDTDITLTLTGKTANAVADVADFGPDGLQFAKSVTLELKGDPALAAGGKSLAVAMEEGGTFKALPGSTFEGGVAKAAIAHFTKFSLVVVDGTVTLVDPASCQDARAKFVACGGDPSGTWMFADFCPDPASLPKDPSNGQCPQYQVAVEMTSTRVFTITGTTTQNGAGTETQKLIGTFPKSCFKVDGGAAESCASFDDPEKNRICANAGENCTCTETTTTEKSAGEPEPYTTSGTTWTNKDGSSSGDYCVSGDILYYREKKADNKEGLLYVLKRKP
jgi:hypothetical protein